MKKLFAFVSNYILPIGTLFLLFFIPVYPKLPVFDIYGTWVYVRIEDFLVASLIGIFLLTRWFERRFSGSKLTLPIIIYWIVGIISALNSILFIGPHLANYLPHLTLLHFLRRIEYMMLFFIAYESLVTRRHLLTAVIWSLAAVLIVIIFYGVGQKFYGFPAFLTMNEEFAKGVPLRLPPTARIVSTFGGHYDLAAYLVMLIPVAGSLVFGLQKIWQKIVFFIITLGSVILLLFTASRISFGVYLIAISTMLFWQKKKLLVIPVIIISFILLNFVGSASERFYKTFRYEDVIVDLSTGKPIGTLDKLEGLEAIVEKSQSPAEENLPQGSGFIGIAPASNMTGKTAVNRVIVSRELTTGTGEVATLSGSFLIQKALVYDISITTRFQGEWPKAIQAFQRNILLGSGYSTLSLAVDGNYHRMLGETGLIGAIFFLGIIAFSYAIYFRGRDALPTLQRSFVTGFFAGLTGLLLNAILIDVFEASKVAFTFWLLMGLSMAILSQTVWKQGYFSYLKSLFLSRFAFALYVLLGTFLLYKDALSGYFLGDDFTWLRWAAQSTWSDLAVSFTDATGFFYRPIPKIWYFALYSIFWLIPGAYHFLSVFLYALICLFLYFILIRLQIRRLFALPAALLFAGLAIHHENVFWVSGQSSLLGTFFMLLAVYLIFVFSNQKYVWIKLLAGSGIFISTFLSMLSYDSLIIGPIIVFLIFYIILEQRKIGNYLILLLIPVYWLIRTYAHAVPPSGDYGYKLSTFFVNSIGNTITYLTGSFIGPSAVEYFASLRNSLRGNIRPVTAVLVIVLLLLFIFFKKIYSHIIRNRKTYVWLICFLVALIPFLGLGGAAERYDLLPSAFLLIFVTVSVSSWLQNRRNFLRWGIVILLYGIIFTWNRYAYVKVSDDWKIASSVSEQTLLKMKYAYFPFGSPKTFIFVDTPIRYGRAWIFPTGLPDALWHMFQQAPFKVIETSDIDAALSHRTVNGESFVHRFENYDLKKIEAQADNK